MAKLNRTNEFVLNLGIIRDVLEVLADVSLQLQRLIRQFRALTRCSEPSDASL